MSATNYRRYVRDTMALAKSLTIKSELSIIGINQYVRELGYEVSTDPYTWKYYLNLAGEPHFLDVEMEVRSLDNRELIPFTKESLESHLVTKENYRVGSWRYKRLVEEYPEQELLIRGILNPVDIHAAIEAPDFAILDYNRSLIESNETNVIDELQKRVYEFNIRWNNPSYAVTDDLYTTANLAVLYARIPGWLMNIRLDNCKTRHAHSFHIREYLKSHGRLDRYFDYLTKAQALWLYRNLLYLERNAGRQETFAWLMEHMLTQRGMGMAEYNVHHNLEGLPDDLRIQPEFTRSALNIYHRSTRIEEHTFEELLNKQRSLALRNREVERETLVDDTRLIQNAKRDTLPTKALESSIIDWSESGVVVRTQFLLNHWVYWAAIGKYKSIIRPIHPRTGARIELTVEDAFIAYLYAYNKAVGVTLSEVPGYTAQCIRRTPAPSFEQLRSLADRELVDDEFIRHATRERTPEFDILSPYQFVDVVSGLFDTYYKHREVYALREDYRVRGQLQGVFDHLYMHVDTPFEDKGENYDQWFARKGLDLSELSNVEYENLAYRLLEDSTGVRLDGTLSPGAIQKAMVGIMEQLSSYNVHYIQEVNPGPIYFWDWSGQRVGEIAGKGSVYQRTKLISLMPSDARFKGYQGIKLDLNRIMRKEYGIQGRLYVHQPTNLTVKTRDTRKDFIRLPLARTRIDIPCMDCT